MPRQYSDTTSGIEVLDRIDRTVEWSGGRCINQLPLILSITLTETRRIDATFALFMWIRGHKF